MSDYEAANTPIEPGMDLFKNPKKGRKDIPYKNLIGKLRYLAVDTRPDIMFSVRYLSQFNDNYGNEHFKCAKRVFRYLKGTRTLEITYKKTNEDLIEMAHVDWQHPKMTESPCLNTTSLMQEQQLAWPTGSYDQYSSTFNGRSQIYSTEKSHQITYIRSKEEPVSIYWDN